MKKDTPTIAQFSDNTKKSRIFVGVILALIAIGFALSTCDQVQLTSTTSVATVNGEEVSYKQYSNSYRRYEEMLGLGNMTAAQREQFNIGQRILDDLINSKLLIQLAKSQNIWPSMEEVKAEIKEQDFFQTDKKFDFNKYKALLQNAELTPAQYEKEMSEQLAQQKLINLLSLYPVSSTGSQLVEKIKKSGLEVTALRLTHSNMKKGLKISNDEIQAFIKDPKNKTVIDNAFDRNKFRYETPASKNIKMISLPYSPDTLAAVEKEANDLRKTLNKSNFEKSPKYDKKQGNVGPVSSGRLPPELEEVLFPKNSGKSLKGTVVGPVKTEQGFLILLVEDEKAETKKSLEQVAPEIAEEQIRSLKTEELKSLVKETVAKIDSLFKSNNLTEIEKLQKDFALTLEKNVILSPIEKQIGPINLETSQYNQLFNGAVANNVVVLENPAETIIVKIEKVISFNDSSTAMAENNIAPGEDSTEKLVQSQRTNIIAKLKEKARISINQKML
jgi:parvulin-like peptidyl-prolyl isomerase